MSRSWRKGRRSIFLVLLMALLPGAAPPRQIPRPEKSPTPADSMLYTCAMHPDVRAFGPGNCPVCGMPLVSLAALRKPVDYVLRLEQVPAAARAGETVRLRFLFFHPDTGAPIKEFQVVHGMPFHLFVVSRDLEFYEHIHPAQQADGSFTIETVLPDPKHYEIFCDIFPVGGAPTVIRRSLAMAGVPESDAGSPAKIEADDSLPKVADGIRFALTVEPPQPVAGRPTRLTYWLVDDGTGLPVKDLEPYLGAWGHALVLRDDITDFLHSHAPIASGTLRNRTAGGPRLIFDVVFAQPGRHRIWSQVQRDHRVVTVPFTVSVSRLDRLARWNGAAWSPLGSGPAPALDGAARALASHGGGVYIGGDFTEVDGVPASHIARWDGRRWTALGSGVNGTVWAIATSGTDVYAGGEFTAAGGRTARGVARWDGRRWSALGGGIRGCRDAFATPAVYALAARGDEVYAGGRFTDAGGIAVDGVAMWNGRSWSALSGGVRTGIYDGVVRALALHGPDLYAGGQFVTAGEAGAYNVARWDGRRWSALGSGIRGGMEKVLAIAVLGSDVYVGGMFGSAGGDDAPNLAKWNGRNWSAEDIRADDGVWTIAVSDGQVYVGGASFRLPDGAATRGIVRGNGRDWSGLGDGIGTPFHPGPIMTIARTGNSVYVGGDAFRLPETERATEERRGETAP